MYARGKMFGEKKIGGAFSFDKTSEVGHDCS